MTTIKGELERQLAKQGDGVRFLTEPCTSPTFVGLIDEFTKRYPKAKWVQYEPVSREGHRRAVSAAFGAPANVVYKLDKAKVALALDCDFITGGPGSVRNARDFMKNRKVRTVPEAIAAGEGVAVGSMNRLYAVESMVTTTGAVADHRLTLKPSQVPDFTKALAAELGVVGVAAPKLTGLAAEWVKPLAADLLAHKGGAVVLVGDTQPAAVHYLALAINEKLGAFGATVTFTEPIETRPNTLDDLRTLTEEMKAGKVDVLFVFGGNPAYDAPADFNFLDALKAMKGTKVRLGLHEDETSFDGQCQWFLNATHYLETWGDVRAFDGTVSVQQPLIAPLYNGKSQLEILATLLSLGINDPQELVSSTWKKFHDASVKGTDFPAWWEKCLRDGVVPGTAAAAKTVTAVKAAGEVLADAAFALPAVKLGGYEVQFRPDPTVYDGRYANTGWLQETPKPVTKLTWDNAAIVSPKTAADLGLKNGFAWTGGENGNTVADMVRLTLDGRKIGPGADPGGKIAAFILPGHADGVITLHLGYGRTRGGKVAAGLDAAPGPGFNTYHSAPRPTSGPAAGRKSRPPTRRSRSPAPRASTSWRAASRPAGRRSRSSWPTASSPRCPRPRPPSSRRSASSRPARPRTSSSSVRSTLMSSTTTTATATRGASTPSTSRTTSGSCRSPSTRRTPKRWAGSRRRRPTAAGEWSSTSARASAARLV